MILQAWSYIKHNRMGIDKSMFKHVGCNKEDAGYEQLILCKFNFFKEYFQNIIPYTYSVHTYVGVKLNRYLSQ